MLPYAIEKRILKIFVIQMIEKGLEKLDMRLNDMESNASECH